MRPLTILLSLLIAAAAFGQEQQPDPEEFGETIFIVRYVLTVKVTDSFGHAIDDLKPEDFTVRVGKSKAHVEGADWISLGGSGAAEPPAEDQEAGYDASDEFDIDEVLPDEGPRSIVLLIQTDFARNSMRVVGQMKFNYIADDIIELFGPTDRIAVLSHDSHLKIRRDFIRDRESLRKAVRESLYTDSPPLPPAATDGPSIIPLLDPREMKKSAHAEASLLLLARALHHIKGPKLIILAGWGMGELEGRAGVVLKPEWNDAVTLLRHDEVPVIALNHGLGAQLSFGLAATASATGGFYAGLQDFPGQAVTRMKGALAGHYTLTLRIDDLLKPGRYPISIRVNRKGAEVQAPEFVDYGQ
jgi:hypothetical protein